MCGALTKINELNWLSCNTGPLTPKNFGTFGVLFPKSNLLVFLVFLANKDLNGANKVIFKNNTIMYGATTWLIREIYNGI